MTYSLGEIEFINYIPLFNLKADFPFPHTLFRACPKDLNNACRKGLLDISPISFFAYSDLEKDYEILPNFCIAGDGEVLSVRLFSKCKLEDLKGKKIYLTNQSESSIGAFTAICKHRYGFNPRDFASSDRNACDALFLIGNEALSFKSPLAYDYDLGLLWQETFATPMVYSAIVAKREIFDGVKAKLSEFFDLNLRNFQANKEHFYALAALEMGSSEFDSTSAKNYYDKLIYKISDSAFAKSWEILHGRFA